VVSGLFGSRYVGASSILHDENGRLVLMNNCKELVDISASAICSRAPCILHIQRLDAVHVDPAMQHATSQETDLQEMFTDAFKLLLRDIRVQLMAMRSATKEQQTDQQQADQQQNDKQLAEEAASLSFPASSNQESTNSYTNMNHAVLVVVSSENSFKLRPAFKSMFATHVPLKKASKVDAANKVSEKETSECTGSNNIKDSTGANDGGDDGDDATASLVVQQYVAREGLEQLAAASLAREVQCARLARAHSHQWVVQLSLTQHQQHHQHQHQHQHVCAPHQLAVPEAGRVLPSHPAAEPRRGPASASAGSATRKLSKKVIRQTHKDITSALQTVPTISGFHTVTGYRKAGGGASDNKISAVHWADIGGLEK
jgi:hypothetical protein